MKRRSAALQAASILALIWLAVWGIRSYAGSRKITAESIQQAIEDARFRDLSDAQNPPSAREAAEREEELRRIAGLLNRLDFHEREKNRRNRSGEEFFRKLSTAEKSLFIELTVAETMGRFMEALDSMPPEQRKRFVEQGLREIREGRTEEEMRRAEELGDDLLDRIATEGMKAYFDKAGTDTKIDLAPLMEAMNELMQGLRGSEFGPRRDG